VEQDKKKILEVRKILEKLGINYADWNTFIEIHDRERKFRLENNPSADISYQRL
jgi:hypothetical protein